MKDHLERLSHSDTSTSSQTRKKSLSEILATSLGKEQKSAESLQLEHKKWKQAEYHAQVEAAEEKRGLPPSQESKFWLGHDKKRYAGIGGMTDREWEGLDDNIAAKLERHGKHIEAIAREHRVFQNAINNIYNRPTSRNLSNNGIFADLNQLNDTLKALRSIKVDNIFDNGKFLNANGPSYIKPSYQGTLNEAESAITDVFDNLRHRIRVYS